MATTAAKTPPQRTNAMEQFIWEGTDKRGVKMKGETAAKNANLLKAELRKQGINPTVVKPKAKPLFGKTGKAISAREIDNICCWPPESRPASCRARSRRMGK